MENPFENYKCYESVGAMSDGKIDEEKEIKHWNDYENGLKDKFNKCMAITGSGPCDTAYKFHGCILKN